MLTKTQLKILEIFTSKIDRKFSINELSLILKKPYPLIHRSIKDLVKVNFLILDERKLLSLNYKSNFVTLSFVESERTKNALLDKKSISLFVKDCLSSIKEDFFIFLIFGSFVDKEKFNDVDIIIILDDKEKVKKTENIIHNLASNFSFKTDIQVLSKESAYEMLSKREQLNILNESLNKHLIVFGGENYYRLLANVRG